MYRSILRLVYIGCAKQKSVFEHGLNVQIEIHPVSVQNLIQPFALHWYILYPMILLADSEGSDQTMQVHKLICPDQTEGCTGWSGPLLSAMPKDKFRILRPICSLI